MLLCFAASCAPAGVGCRDRQWLYCCYIGCRTYATRRLQRGIYRGDALLIARENVHQYQVRVELKMEDALHPSAAAMQQQFDIIVSNPPYICDKERTGMAKNVLAYEPETALFVPDDDPLRFYRAIAEYSVQACQLMVHFISRPTHYILIM